MSRPPLSLSLSLSLLIVSATKDPFDEQYDGGTAPNDDLDDDDNDGAELSPQDPPTTHMRTPAANADNLRLIAAATTDFELPLAPTTIMPLAPTTIMTPVTAGGNQGMTPAPNNFFLPLVPTVTMTLVTNYLGDHLTGEFDNAAYNHGDKGHTSKPKGRFGKWRNPNLTTKPFEAHVIACQHSISKYKIDKKRFTVFKRAGADILPGQELPENGPTLGLVPLTVEIKELLILKDHGRRFYFVWPRFMSYKKKGPNRNLDDSASFGYKELPWSSSLIQSNKRMRPDGDQLLPSQRRKKTEKSG